MQSASGRLNFENIDMPTTEPFKNFQPDLKNSTAVVPAVERAVAVLNFLQENSNPASCTVTQIAKALDLHKSNCSNILRTLEAASLVEYDPNTKAYMLGAALIGLGATATRRRDILQIGIRHIDALVRETGLSCVIFSQLPNKAFLIIGKVDSPKDIKVTIDVGQHFAPGAPALARIAMSWMDKDGIDTYIANHGLSRFTPETKVETAEILQEIALIRTQGYSISRGEYYPGHNAISAPVFTAQDEVCRGICLVGFASQMDDNDLPRLGELVKSTANAITQAIGGQQKKQSLHPS